MSELNHAPHAGVPDAALAARLLTDISNALTQYANVMAGMRLVLPGHADTCASVARELGRQQDVLRGVVDAVRGDDRG